MCIANNILKSHELKNNKIQLDVVDVIRLLREVITCTHSAYLDKFRYPTSNLGCMTEFAIRTASRSWIKNGGAHEDA